MANKNVFKTASNVPETDTVNQAGGLAYSRSPKDQLAQFAATGCFNDTFYGKAADQVTNVVELANQIDDNVFLAKLAVHSRKQMKMKDMPALLTAILSTRDVGLFRSVFPSVIDDVKMLRNFVQIIRSGVAGRKSLGTSPKNAIWEFLNNRSPATLFRSSIGDSPSLGDVIKLAHPKPLNQEANAVYRYLSGKKLSDAEFAAMPKIYHDLELFRTGESDVIPNVPFEFLTSSELTLNQWKNVAMNMTWNQTRMNLNMLKRKGVFDDPKMVHTVAKRLKDHALIQKSNAFPYQLMSAYLNVQNDMPRPITLALQEAVDIATFNVPSFAGKDVTVLVDVSGSMGSSVTGHRGSATSKMRCVHVAGLMASCILKKNHTAKIVTFDFSAKPLELNPFDSVMTNTKAIFKNFGGGTSMSSAFQFLNNNHIKSDITIVVSDNESWFDGSAFQGYGRVSGVAQEWSDYNRRVNHNKGKLACIDITPSLSVMTSDKRDKNILNIGGFSDQVFNTLSRWVESDGKPNFWVDLISDTEI